MSGGLTWGEFKALVDKTVPDDTEIWYIDVGFPMRPDGDLVTFIQDGLGVAIH